MTQTWSSCMIRNELTTFCSKERCIFWVCERITAWKRSPFVLLGLPNILSGHELMEASYCDFSEVASLGQCAASASFQEHWQSDSSLRFWRGCKVKNETDMLFLEMLINLTCMNTSVEWKARHNAKWLFLPAFLCNGHDLKSYIKRCV